MSFFSKIGDKLKGVWDYAADKSKDVWHGLTGAVGLGGLSGSGQNSGKSVAGGWQQWLPLAGSALEGWYSGKQAGKAQDFAAEMSGTAHQREVFDLRAAGLNPILSGTGGAGSPSPSGVVPHTPDISSALMARQQLKLLQAQTELTDSSTRNNNFQFSQNQKYGDMERQAGIWSARESAANTGKTGQKIDSEIRTLATDLESRKVSLEDAQLRLKNLRNNPALLDWIQSADYAQRETFDRATKGNASLGEMLYLLKSILR